MILHYYRYLSKAIQFLAISTAVSNSNSCTDVYTFVQGTTIQSTVAIHLVGGFCLSGQSPPPVSHTLLFIPRAKLPQGKHYRHYYYLKTY